MHTLGKKSFVALLGALSLAAIAGVSTPAIAAESAGAAVNNCLGNICVGMSVRINYGHWAGHSGAVVGVDHYNHTITVVNSSGYYLYPSLNEVSPMHTGNPNYCTSSVCVGDRIQVLGGASRGLIGQVVGTNDYSFTATVLLPSGRYLETSVRNLHVLSRNSGNYPRPGNPNPYPDPYPNPYPNPRQCPPGQVYDYYRGCVRVSSPYPIPPHRVEPPRGPRYPRQYPGCPNGTNRNGRCRR